MKIGASAFAWTSKFEVRHLDILPVLKELGLRGVEIPMFDPGALPVGSIRNAVQRHNLECTVCAILPSQFNPISPDRDTRLAAIQHLKRCVETTAELGAKLIGGPLFAPIGYLPEHRPTPDEWTWATEAFQALREDLHSSEITLSIEPVNRSETFLVRTAEDAIRLCESIGDPRIGVTIDTFHANIEECSIPGAIRRLGHHLRHVHASENDRGPLGRGHVPFSQIMAALREIEFDGFVMIEGFGYSPTEQHAPGYLWANLDVSPEIAVSESARYLKSILSTSES